MHINFESSKYHSWQANEITISMCKFHCVIEHRFEGDIIDNYRSTQISWLIVAKVLLVYMFI